MEAADRPPVALSTLAEAVTNSIRYWEPRRLIYNAVLTVVVVLYFVAGLPDSRGALSVDLGLMLFHFAVVANILYCFGYVVDLFVQLSALRDGWLRLRWVLFLIGTAFAANIARFISMHLFT